MNPSGDRLVPRVILWSTLLLCTLVLGTGIALTAYYLSDPATSYDQIRYLQFDVSWGITLRTLHQASATLLVAWVGALGLVRAIRSARRRESFLRPALAAALAVTVAVTIGVLPWDAISERAAPLLGHEGPFADLVGVNPRYDARSFLSGGKIVGEAAMVRFWVHHAVAVALLGAAALCLRRKASRARRRALDAGEKS